MSSNRGRKVFVVAGSYRNAAGLIQGFDTVCESRAGVQDFLYSIAAANWPSALGRIPPSRKTAVTRFFAPNGDAERTVDELSYTLDSVASGKASAAEAKVIVAARKAARAESLSKKINDSQLASTATRE